MHDRIFTGRVHIYKRTIASHRHRFVSNKFVYVLSLQNTLVKWDCSSNIEFYSWKKLAFYWFRKVAVDWWNEYIYIWLVQETRLWLVLFDTVEPKKGERAQQCVPSFALTRQVYHGITATRKTNVITIQTPRNKRKKTKSRLQASSSTYKEETNKGSKTKAVKSAWQRYFLCAWATDSHCYQCGRSRFVKWTTLLTTLRIFWVGHHHRRRSDTITQHRRSSILHSLWSVRLCLRL